MGAELDCHSFLVFPFVIFFFHTGYRAHYGFSCSTFTLGCFFSCSYVRTMAFSIAIPFLFLIFVFLDIYIQDT